MGVTHAIRPNGGRFLLMDRNGNVGAAAGPDPAPPLPAILAFAVLRANSGIGMP